MLIGTLEICTAVLSLVCMFVTLLCIVFGVRGSHIPTFVALAGCGLYVMFLALAKQNMDISEQHTFSVLIFAFAFFAIIAEGLYREAKKQKRAETKEKINAFKHNCSEARNASYILIN